MSDIQSTAGLPQFIFTPDLTDCYVFIICDFQSTDSSCILLSDFSSRQDAWFVTAKGVKTPHKIPNESLSLVFQVLHQTRALQGLWLTYWKGVRSQVSQKVIEISLISWGAMMYIETEADFYACGGFFFFSGVFVYQRLFYSDILISCFRQRQQHTRCTPTCIISRAPLLVTSPFPQAFL